MAASENRVICDPYSAVAFYGIDLSAPSLRAFYDRVLAWTDAKGIHFDRGYLRGAGYSGKTISFKRARAELDARAFQNLEGFCCVVMTPDGDDVVRHAVVSAGGGTVGSGASVGMLCVEASATITSLDDASFLTLAVQCISAINAAYGIGFQMDHGRGPPFYAGGVNYQSHLYGPPVCAPDEDAERVSDWGTIGLPDEVYREGLLRDVYPWNFLTGPHVRRRLHGCHLLDWIARDPARGVARAISDNAWLWQVPQANLVDVHNVLWEAGLIFDRKRHTRSFGITSVEKALRFLGLKR